MIRVLAALIFLIQIQAPTPCSWGSPENVGTLDNVVNESSGMAVSRRNPNRSYRINDSGDTGRFFVMDIDGKNVKAVNIAGFAPADNEDMAIGPCGDSDCLFIGDIGDNARRRENLEIVVVKEVSDFPSEVQPLHRVRVKYPDGPHDAESLAVHPDGTLYITTKDATRSQIFKLSRDRWSRSGNGPVETLEPVMALDWAKVLPNVTGLARQATGMDIAADGKRFVILTYGEAVEFHVDLSGIIADPQTWKEGQHYRRIPVTILEQQEAIAYMPDGRGLLYDTERTTATGSARILKLTCKLP